MVDYVEKEIKCLNDIVEVITKLDKNLDELTTLESDPEKHKVKTWYYEKKSLIEIKKILHDIKKYDKYDEKEAKKIDKALDDLLNVED